MSIYSIHDLLQIFPKHSESYKKSQKEFEEKTGNKSSDDFNLPEALLCICEEIHGLTNKKSN